MMERFDELNDEGHLTGRTVSREEAHREGIWHRTLHGWILVGDEVLLQLRGSSQEANPNLWDISFAGHLSAGENVLSGLLREAQEELGLDLDAGAFTPLGKVRSCREAPDFIDREVSEVYVVDLDEKPTLAIDGVEVVDTRWVSVNALLAMSRRGDPELVEHREEVEWLVDHARNLQQLAQNQQ